MGKKSKKNMNHPLPAKPTWAEDLTVEPLLSSTHSSPNLPDDPTMTASAAAHPSNQSISDTMAPRVLLPKYASSGLPPPILEHALLVPRRGIISMNPPFNFNFSPSTPPTMSARAGHPPGGLSNGLLGKSHSTPQQASSIPPIKDLSKVHYPPGIMAPDIGVNIKAADDGNFVYSRGFLLQFMKICKTKPDKLPPLGTWGIEPRSVPGSIGDSPIRHTQRGRQRNAALKPAKAELVEPSIQYPSGIAPSVKRTPPLERPANIWVAGSTMDALRKEREAYWHSHIDRKVKCLLNKLTRTNLNSVADQVVEYANISGTEGGWDSLMRMARFVFDSGVNEERWGEVHAKLCRKLITGVSSRIRKEGIHDGASQSIAGGPLFRQCLLQHCRIEYRQRWNTNEPSHAVAGTDGDTVEGKQGLAGGSLNSLKLDRRCLGLIKFIGELFKESVLDDHAMHSCIMVLLIDQDHHEENIEILCRLLIATDQLLDTPKARNKIENYLERMGHIVQTHHVSRRVEFMLLDVIELRNRGWTPRNVMPTSQRAGDNLQQLRLPKVAGNIRGSQKIGLAPSFPDSLHTNGLSARITDEKSFPPVDNQRARYRKEYEMPGALSPLFMPDFDSPSGVPPPSKHMMGRLQNNKATGEGVILGGKGAGSQVEEGRTGIGATDSWADDIKQEPGSSCMLQ